MNTDTASKSNSDSLSLNREEQVEDGFNEPSTSVDSHLTQSEEPCVSTSRKSFHARIYWRGKNMQTALSGGFLEYDNSLNGSTPMNCYSDYEQTQLYNCNQNAGVMNFGSQTPLVIENSGVNPFWSPTIFGPNSADAEEMTKRHLVWNNLGSVVDAKTYGILLDPRGYLTVRVNENIEVNITVDKGFRYCNDETGIIMAVSGAGTSSAMIHPGMSLYQVASRVEAKMAEPSVDEKFVKFGHKGISFSSENCPLVYLVDCGGVRSHADKFSDLYGDIPGAILGGPECQIGTNFIPDCAKMMQYSSYWTNEIGEELWQMNNVRVKRAADGTFTVARQGSKYVFVNKMSLGLTTLITPFFSCIAEKASQGLRFYMERNRQLMYYDLGKLTIRNGMKRTGFDENNRLKIY